MIASEPTTLRAADGHELPATIFAPPATRAVDLAVVVAPETGVERTEYFELAEAMAESGAGVIVPGYRATASAAGDRGRLDLACVLDVAGEAWPEAPSCVVAHGAGGWLAGWPAGVGRLRGMLVYGGRAICAAAPPTHAGSFAGRLRAVTAVDDEAAPPAAARALLALYRASTTELRRVTPRDLRVGAIGHLGYLRLPAGPRLWEPDLAWLRACVR